MEEQQEIGGEDMRRWNGWGDEATSYPLPESAGRFLEAKIGKGTSIPDVAFERAVAIVPPSRLKPYLHLSLDPADRLYHARGQSLPDWVALRYGRFEAFPDGVAYPASDVDVRDLFAYARRSSTRLIPFGGGTSVVGHINPRPIDIIACSPPDIVPASCVRRSASRGKLCRISVRRDPTALSDRSW